MYENLRKATMEQKLRKVSEMRKYDNLREDMTSKIFDVVLCFVMEEIKA